MLSSGVLLNYLINLNIIYKSFNIVIFPLHGVNLHNQKVKLNTITPYRGKPITTKRGNYSIY